MISGSGMGISGFNGMYGYQSAVNQLRLAQVMSQRTNAASQTSASKAPSTVTEMAKQYTNRFSSSLDYVDSYSSKMTDLMASANSLRNVNSANAFNKLDLSSSDASVVTASNRFRLNEATSYDINVTQLAAAQKSMSDAMASTAAGSDFNLEITNGAGATNIAVSALAEDGSQKTNQQVLTEAAKAINDADAGLKASVIDENGSSRLQIESTKTGADSQFFTSGSFASHMNNVTQAQDAKYSVKQNGVTKDYTSASNDVRLDFGRIDMTLKKTGSATLTVGANTDKVVSAMEDLVKSYNSVVNLLNDNTDRGSGSARQLNRLGFVPGAKQDMDLLGLSKAKDGSLVLDKEKLAKNMKEHPDLTKDLISGYSGIAQRAFNAAQNGLNTSVNSLVSNDIKQADYESITSPINFMNSYNRSGAYNMMNYYASGLLYSMMV